MKCSKCGCTLTHACLIETTQKRKALRNALGAKSITRGCAWVNREGDPLLCSGCKPPRGWKRIRGPHRTGEVRRG